MSAYERIKAFLLRPSPSMFYGLYCRQELLKIFDFKNSFDFYDCALLIRILAKSPVKIFPKVLYRAGIDDSEYIVKSQKKVGDKSKLAYFPFLKYSFETIANCNMPVSLKMAILPLFLKFIVENYVHHEKDYAIQSFSGLLKYKMAVAVESILRFFKK
jgi:hypothetical protein